MDPIERVNIDTDTTFAFMLAAQARGHTVYYVPPAGLELDGDAVFVRGKQVRLQRQKGAHVEDKGAVRLAARDLSAIFVRTDPPFDQDYLCATWILSFAEKQGTLVVNSARGLRSANEKLYALEFPELCPETMVTASRDAARQFVATIGGEAIAKPIDGHGGLGVFRLRAGDSNVSAIVDHLTREGRRSIILQRFLPAVADGDKRLILIEGELRGAVKRLPPKGEHRGNVHVGGTAVACDISPSDQAIALRMAPRLRDDGLFFVGLDVIEDKLIEVNVTSPTLVQELHRLGGPDLAVELIERVERRLAARPP
jgi:glutathione synthase